MSTRVKVNMKPVNTILTRLGVDKNGDVQRFVTNTISNRLYKYIPKRGGVLEKSKYITSPTEIEVIQPYATFQYYGNVMVGTHSRSAWAKKDEPKEVIDKKLTYDTSKKPLAGPKWDKRMMANEKDAIAADVQDHVNRGKK
ncbi:minor capsid protein [Oscillibacter sp.]|uniref:minor capsid protein n=1 Tax=Oscillibacter sp. TaxID=1945593 RepID=UPI0028A247E8|nr:minor capsid protein [Oscillibacter sp.]